jgi:hypothetical protein
MDTNRESRSADEMMIRMPGKDRGRLLYVLAELLFASMSSARHACEGRALLEIFDESIDVAEILA